jgi:hypothetical protein
MRRVSRAIMAVALLALVSGLSACQNFDPDNLDVFNLNEKKKLPGDRKPVFPEGVPGVSQGVPPELIKGAQPPPETASAIPPEPERVVEKPKPKPKPKPKQAARQPAQISSQPGAQNQPPAPWPSQQQQTQQQPAQAPWPAPGQTQTGQPGTFQR